MIMDDIFIVILIGILIIGVIVIVGGVIQNDKDYGTVEGIIIEKDYNPTYTSMFYSGKVFIPVHHSENWKIKIKRTIEEKEKTRWVEVKEDTYNNLNIGDYYKESD